MAVPPGIPDAAGLVTLRRRTTGVLVTSQILGGLGVATAVTLSAVLAKEVSGSEALSGLAPTSSVIGSALLSLPLAVADGCARAPRRTHPRLPHRSPRRHGRRGRSGGGQLPSAAVRHDGLRRVDCANLQARFAAADLAEPEQRARPSRSSSGRPRSARCSARTSPRLPDAASPAWASPRRPGAFVWAGGVFLLRLAGASAAPPGPVLTARALAAADRRRTPRNPRPRRRRPPAPLRRRPFAARRVRGRRRLPAGPAGAGHHRRGAHRDGLDHGDDAGGPRPPRRGHRADRPGHQRHIAGMYAFSPVMGWLADRFGRLRVIVLRSPCCRARPLSPVPRRPTTASRPPVCSCSASAGRRGWSPARRC